jgi:hypothetical protein
MFKTDLAKEFDSVGWVFLLDLPLGSDALTRGRIRSPPSSLLLVLEFCLMASQVSEFAMVADFSRGPPLAHALCVGDGVLPPSEGD